MIVPCSKCGTKNRVDERSKDRQAVCGKCGAVLPSPEKPATLDVTDESFAEAVLSSPVPVLLDCWAPWCGPCRMLTPTLESLAGESHGKYLVAKLNVDENPGVAARFNISSIPNVLLFHQGKLIEQIVGVRPRVAYHEALQAFVK